MAAAPLAASNKDSLNVRPPTVQYTPFSSNGTPPSTARIYLPFFSAMIFLRCSSNGSPDAAANVSSYSKEIIFKITSDVNGEEERIKDSLQPVHS